MEHVYPIFANLALGISVGALVAVLWMEIKGRRAPDATLEYLWDSKHSLFYDGTHWFVSSGLGGKIVGGLHDTPGAAIAAAKLEKVNGPRN